MLRDSLAWTILLLVEAIVVSVFLSNAWLREQIESERQQTLDFLGYETSVRVIERTNDLYSTLLRESGVIPFTYSLFLPKSDTALGPTPGYEMGRYFTFFRGRLDAIWTSMYQATQRLALFLEWLPYLLPFLIPCLVDGLVKRQIKKTNYGYASQVRYHLASHIIVALIFAPLLYAFLPFAVTPVIVPIWIFCFGAAIALLSANIQKLF